LRLDLRRPHSAASSPAAPRTIAPDFVATDVSLPGEPPRHREGDPGRTFASALSWSLLNAAAGSDHTGGTYSVDPADPQKFRRDLLDRGAMF